MNTCPRANDLFSQNPLRGLLSEGRPHDHLVHRAGAGFLFLTPPHPAHPSGAAADTPFVAPSSRSEPQPPPTPVPSLFHTSFIHRSLTTLSREKQTAGPLPASKLSSSPPWGPTQLFPSGVLHCQASGWSWLGHSCLPPAPLPPPSRPQKPLSRVSEDTSGC